LLLTSWTRQQSRSERQVCWRYRRSAGVSSSAWAATGSPDPVVALGSGLLSSAGTYGSAFLFVCCVICDTSSSTVGAGLLLLSVGHHVLVISLPLIATSDDGISWDNSEFNSQHAILQGKYSTTLLEELTSWDVVLVTFDFLATRLCATLHGFLSGVGRLASRLAGGSSMRGILGSPGRLNLDRS
jgi:hypothetical protein